MPFNTQAIFSFVRNKQMYYYYVKIQNFIRCLRSLGYILLYTSEVKTKNDFFFSWGGWFFSLFSWFFWVFTI